MSNKIREPEVTYRIMSAIKSKNTKPERMLGTAMWKLGLRYRKHYTVMGKPDFAFIKLKIAVFCDGDYWHGNNWKIRGLASLQEELDSYTDYWRNKILRNIERDRKVNGSLEKLGWTVLRFWESDIKKSASDCANKVLETVNAEKEISSQNSLT
ncbi:MAG: very short patch repair endonuclease [Chlorobi bacterium]|nr:very short patch repair endonuclease [Chlorobiota bacterium]